MVAQAHGIYIYMCVCIDYTKITCSTNSLAFTNDFLAMASSVAINTALSRVFASLVCHRLKAPARVGE